MHVPTDLHCGIKRLRARDIVHHQCAERPLKVHLIGGEAQQKEREQKTKTHARYLAASFTRSSDLFLVFKVKRVRL